LNLGCHIYGFKEKDRVLADYELVTLFLSVLEWNRYNGPINLVCNAYFKDYADSIGLSDLYNEIKVIEVPASVNQEVFWAAIKIYAYDQYPIGTTFIDIDATIRTSVSEYIKPETKILVAHFDDAKGELDNLVFPKDFSHPEWLRKTYTFEGLNMCLVCFLDEQLRGAYLKTAREFMENNQALPSENYSNYGMMIFAEQCVIHDLCKHFKTEPTYVMPVFPVSNGPMSHLWQAKHVFKQIESEKNHYMERIKSYICFQYNTELWQPLYSRLLSGNQAQPSLQLLEPQEI